MANNAEDFIKSLQAAVQKDDHNEVYEYSKILLKQFPDDQQYLQCLIISSLKINVLDELEHIFKNIPNKQSLKPLYVYYLYFIGEYQKTISYLQTLLQKQNKKQYKILLAQTYFKINDQAASAKIMLDLIKESGKAAKQDLEFYLVNLFATSLNKNLDKNIIEKYRNIMKEKHSRQVYYNYALLLVSLEDYKTALQCLGQFQRFLQKGENDDEIRISFVLKDYIMFKTQLSKANKFSMQVEERQKKIEDYERMLTETSEVNLKSVLKNNKVFLKCQNSDQILQNFHQILKIIDEGLQKRAKPSKSQQFILKLNKFTILLKKNRLTEAAKILKDIQTNYDNENFCKNDLDLIKGKYFLLKRSFKESKKEKENLLGFLNNISKMHKNLGFCLVADLKREEGQQKQFVAQLKEQNHSSIIKNYIFSLLLKNPDLFEEYHEYLSELLEKTNDFKILEILLKLYENKKDQAKQQKILNKILKINPKDVESKVKLAEIEINRGNLNTAEQLLKGVQKPEEINDINYLQHIQKNIHISIKRDELIVPTKKDDKALAHQNLKKRIKKKKKPKYPKKMEVLLQNYKGDPERWLPKWQRKGFKKKGKKGPGKTQGLATVGKQETKNIFTTSASTSAKQVTKETGKKRRG